MRRRATLVPHVFSLRSKPENFGQRPDNNTFLYLLIHVPAWLQEHGISSPAYNADWHGAAQLSSISAAARLPSFLSATSRERSSSALSSDNTLFICPECFLKAGTMRSFPRGVRAMIRPRRSSALSTRVTKPFAKRRSTAILIEPGVKSTIGPIVLTGKGPLFSRTSSTPKSDRPSPVSSIPAAAYLVRARSAFIITSQAWSVP